MCNHPYLVTQLKVLKPVNPILFCRMSDEGLNAWKQMVTNLGETKHVFMKQLTDSWLLMTHKHR